MLLFYMSVVECSPCRRLLTTIMLELMSVTFAVAVTTDVEVANDIDPLAKNTDLGCSATNINSSITHSI